MHGRKRSISNKQQTTDQEEREMIQGTEKNFHKLKIVFPKRLKKALQEQNKWDFPGGAVVKNLPANAGDTGLIPGPGRSHMPWIN